MGEGERLGEREAYPGVVRVAVYVVEAPEYVVPLLLGYVGAAVEYRQPDDFPAFLVGIAQVGAHDSTVVGELECVGQNVEVDFLYFLGVEAQEIVIAGFAPPHCVEKLNLMCLWAAQGLNSRLMLVMNLSR